MDLLPEAGKSFDQEKKAKGHLFTFLPAVLFARRTYFISSPLLFHHISFFFLVISCPFAPLVSIAVVVVAPLLPPSIMRFNAAFASALFSSASWLGYAHAQEAAEESTSTASSIERPTFTVCSCLDFFRRFVLIVALAVDHQSSLPRAIHR